MIAQLGIKSRGHYKVIIQQNLFYVKFTIIYVKVKWFVGKIKKFNFNC